MRIAVFHTMAGIAVLTVIMCFAIFWHMFIVDTQETNSFKSVLSGNFVFIAHGLGGIDGKSITNSREAFEKSYQSGKRVVEADLMFTADGELVAFHEGIEQWFGWKKKIYEMRADEFLREKLFGKFSTMTFENLLSLLEDHSDVWLIIDTKDNFDKSLTEMVRLVNIHNPDLLKRIIPQVYREDDVNFIQKEYPQIKEVIMALYRVDYDDERVIQLVVTYPEIIAISMSQERFSEDLVSRLGEKGVVPLVHTINDEDAIERYSRLGVGGVYTDK